MTVLPPEAFLPPIAIVGTVGSGKTYTAKGLLERQLSDGARVCVIDPTGAWWGLKSNADGTAPGFRVVIFGGDHADVPIDDTQGTTLANVVAGGALQCVIDVSGMTMGGRVRFMRAFLEALYHLNKTTLYLVLDEADLFAPQRALPDQTVMLNRCEQIVRRGRIKGFRVMMITQRPAELHKSVLSQAGTLIAMKLTAPQDRDAIGAWIEGQADLDQGKALLADLPRLAPGEGYVWCPAQGVLDKTRFPKIRTLDSSRTPEPGDAPAEPISMATFDLAAIRQQLEAARASSTAAEIKGRRGRAAVAPASEATPAALEAARGAGIVVGRTEAFDSVIADLNRIQAEVASTLQRVSTARTAAEAWQAPAAGGAGSKAAERPAMPPKSRSERPVERARATPRPTSAGSPVHAAASKLTAALVRQGRALSWGDICIVAGIVPGNGYFYGGRKDMLARGFVHEAGDLVEATAAAQSAVGQPPAPLTAAELVDQWRGKLKAPAGEMLRYLAARPGQTLTASELAAGIQAKPGNGYWYGGIKALRVAGLIEEGHGTYRVCPLLR